MKDMKTRIIALILTVVMALLALTSCSNSYDLATENLDAYAEFNLDKFLEALQNIEIEDGEFTTDDATREKLTAAQVYNTIVDKIVAATKEEDHVKSGELTAGDVLYFVYYAVDADKNEFFGTQMKPSSITDKSYAANHVIKLGDNFDKKGEEFFKLLVENLPEDLSQIKLEDYVFSSLTAAELQSKALEELFDHKYMRGEKSADIKVSKFYNPEKASDFGRVREVTDRGLELIREHYNSENRVRTVSTRLLEYHAEYTNILAEAMAYKCVGKDKEADEKIDELMDKMGAHEQKIEMYYDHCLAINALKASIFKFNSNIYMD